MASADDDIMSSPDPLNGSLNSSALSVTRRVTRSQRPERFISLGRSMSPRKQTFQLEVGDNRSPQKLFVTVEAESELGDEQRQLFTTPTPTVGPVIRRREKTTTTTVPLKEDDGEEAATAHTPKRRGRPPKSAGTPKATPATRKRAATPAKKTPRGRKPKAASTEEHSIADSSAQGTPKTARAKRVTKRKPNTPAEASAGLDTTAKKKRGRGRPALVLEEAADMTDRLIDIVPDTPVEDATGQSLETDASANIASPQSAAPSAAESEPDIWMATVSDEETPRQTSRRTSGGPGATPIPRRAIEGDEDMNQADGNDVEQAATESVQSEPFSEAGDMAGPGVTTRDLDTIAQGEDFSMIFMDSIPSMQRDRSELEQVQEEMGEETSLIVNNTLEALRRNMVGQTAEQEGPALGNEPPIAQEDRQSADHDAQDPPNLADDIPMVSPMRVASPRLSSPRSSPRRKKALPLSRQLLSFRSQSGNSPIRQSIAGSPAQRQSPARIDESMAYEDSFSEIPQDILEAATPRRPRAMGFAEAAEPAIPSSAPRSARSSIAQSTPARPLTPDDTPSPPDDEEQSSTKQDSTTQHLPGVPEISLSHQPTSEVFEANSGQSRRRDSRADETPANPSSSPRLPQPKAQNLLAPTATANASRPRLSPIVRAGRALQNVTSDPPSPEGRLDVLGSPFSSSHSSKQNSGPPAINAFPARVLPQGLSTDDPFGPASQQTGQRGFLRALSENSRTTVEPQPDKFNSVSSSMRVTPPDDDAMSWIAEEGSLRMSLRGGSHDDAMSITAVKGSFSKPDGANVDAADEQITTESDDEDIWAAEASRRTPRSARKQLAFGNSSQARHSRSKLPSPWRKQAAVPEQQAPAGTADQSAADVQEATGIDEFSLLSQQNKHRALDDKPETSTTRFSLTDFFSSPAQLPRLAAGFISSLARSPAPNPVDSSAGKSSKVMEPTLQTTSMFPPVPQKTFTPGRSRSSLFSPSKAQANRPVVEPQHDQSPPSPEQREMFPHVAQKLNFTPRPRQAGQPGLNFSSPSKTAVTPPKMQLSHDEIEKWQQESSILSDEESEFVRPQLRPLPAPNVSPTKSCIRSPMKPHTPGRVVEFTSSTLSPLQQAMARAGKHSGNQGQASQPPFGLDEEADKENSMVEDHDVSMNDAPAVSAPKSPSPARLSQTTWSRQHWLLLDKLLQLRRRGPFGFDTSTGFKRNSQKYLGRVVTSQGESMEYEQWHLDVVDAFKAEVGGWDEGVLAKRLFSLMVGEERRRNGLVGSKRPTTVFH